MCGPAALIIGSLVVTAIGGYVAYDASKKAQAYNEQVANNNTRIAEYKAIDAERLGQIEASERRLKTRLQIGQQVTGFAAQNVEASGTALQILGDTEMFGQMDELRIRGNAARQAWGFRQEGVDFQNQKRLDSFKAKAGRTGTILSTAGSMLGTASQFNFGGGSGSAGAVTSGGFGAANSFAGAASSFGH